MAVLANAASQNYHTAQIASQFERAAHQLGTPQARRASQNYHTAQGPTTREALLVWQL